MDAKHKDFVKNAKSHGIECYNINCYGMILDEETIRTIGNKMFGACPDDYLDIVSKLYNNGVLDWIGEFSGESAPIDDNGLILHDSRVIHCCDSLIYIPLKYDPQLFLGYIMELDDIIKELKGKVGEYLPENFDYRDRVRYICGCCFE